MQDRNVNDIVLFELFSRLFNKVYIALKI